mgnify:CR=1 FL=1
MIVLKHFRLSSNTFTLKQRYEVHGYVMGDYGIGSVYSTKVDFARSRWRLDVAAGAVYHVIVVFGDPYKSIDHQESVRACEVQGVRVCENERGTSCVFDETMLMPSTGT